MNKRKQSKNTRSFERVRLVFFAVCDKFWRQYGGEFEDVISDGYECFMEVLCTHDGSRSELAADVRFRVWHKLLELRECRVRRARLLPMEEVTEEDLEQVEARPELSQFDLKSFLSGLADDVQTVVRLTLDAPKPLLSAAKARKGREGYYMDFKFALKTYLRNTGWPVRRVRAGYEGVREALVR